jgi:hypothetical protein
MKLSASILRPLQTTSPKGAKPSRLLRLEAAENRGAPEKTGCERTELGEILWLLQNGVRRFQNE